MELLGCSVASRIHVERDSLVVSAQAWPVVAIVITICLQFHPLSSFLEISGAN